jgi:hypothetical protein
MRVVTYSTSEPDVPEKLRAVAHLIEGREMLPMRFAAATEGEAAAHAHAWIVAETAKVADQIEARRKAREAREAAKEAAARKAAEAGEVA